MNIGPRSKRVKHQRRDTWKLATMEVLMRRGRNNIMETGIGGE